MDAALEALSSQDYPRAARLAEGALRAAPSFLRPLLRVTRATALLQLGDPGARAQLAMALDIPGAIQAFPQGSGGMLSNCIWGLGEQRRAALAAFNDALVRVPRPTQAQLFNQEHLQYLLGDSQFDKADAVLQQYGRYASNCNALTDVMKARESLAYIVGRSCLAICAEGQGGDGPSVGATAGARSSSTDLLAKQGCVSTGLRMFRLALKLNLPRLLDALAVGKEALAADALDSKGPDDPKDSKDSKDSKELPFKSQSVPQMREPLLHRQHLGTMLSGLVEFDTALSLISGEENEPLQLLYDEIRRDEGAAVQSPEKGVTELAEAVKDFSPRLYGFIHTSQWDVDRQTLFWIRQALSCGEADLLAVAQALCKRDVKASELFLAELDKACFAIWGSQLTGDAKLTEAVHTASEISEEKASGIPPPLQQGATVSIDLKLALLLILSSRPDLVAEPESIRSKCYSVMMHDIVGILSSSHRLRGLLALSAQCRTSFHQIIPVVLTALEHCGQDTYALYLRSIDFFFQWSSFSDEDRQERFTSLMSALRSRLAAEGCENDDAEFERLEALFGIVATLGCIAIRDRDIREAFCAELLDGMKCLMDQINAAPKSIPLAYPFFHLMHPLLTSLISALSAGTQLYLHDPSFATFEAFDVEHIMFETYAPLLLSSFLVEGSLISPDAAISPGSRSDLKPVPPKKGPAAQKALPKTLQAALKRAAKNSARPPPKGLNSLRFPPRYVNFRKNAVGVHYADLGAAAVVSGVTTNFISSLQATANAGAESMVQAISPVQYFDGLWFRQRLERSAYTRLCVALEAVYMIVSGWAFGSFSSELREELGCCLSAVRQLPVVREQDLLSNIDSSLFSSVSHLIPVDRRMTTVIGSPSASLFKFRPDFSGDVAHPDDFAIFTRLLFGDTETMQFCIPEDAFTSAQLVETVRLFELMIQPDSSEQVGKQLERVRGLKRPPERWSTGINVLPPDGLFTNPQFELILRILEGGEVTEGHMAILRTFAGLDLTVFAPFLLAALSVAEATKTVRSTKTRKEVCAAALTGLSGKDSTTTLLSSAFRALEARLSN